MQIRAFYRTPDMPTGVDHTHETTGMLPENIEKSVLAFLQGLLEDPTVMKGVQEKIIAIPDHTEQMFAQATFNRMTRLG